jgi:membrane protein DedA with SNARE-associated domain
VSSEIVVYITEYGYLAIFLLVLLQELGVPNPVTNEFVLLLAGYLAFSGVLNFGLVLLTAVSADCIGTSILYAAFYWFGQQIVERRPRWLPISPAHIERISRSLSERKVWGIYVGRHIPFLRGYVSVAAGVLRVPAKTFLPAVAVSAMTWSGGYVIAGYLVGPYWEQVAAKAGYVESLVLVAVLIAIATLALRAIIRKSRLGDGPV